VTGNRDLMTAGEIYNAIGQTISDSISEDWSEATLHIDRLDKYVSLIGSYVSGNGETKRLDHALFGYKFSKLIHRLHEITTEGGSNKWNKLQFRVMSAGQFQLDFKWDQDFQDQIDKHNQ
jgi:hypothetical protein